MAERFEILEEPPSPPSDDANGIQVLNNLSPENRRRWMICVGLLSFMFVFVTTLLCLIMFHSQPEDPEIQFFMNDRVKALTTAESFAQLNETQKEFLYHAVRASWFGSLIVFAQASYECTLIFGFLMTMLHRKGSAIELRHYLMKEIRFTHEETENLYLYTAAFLNYQGNYRYTSNTYFRPLKFIPKVPYPKMDRLLKKLIENQDDYYYLKNYALNPMYDWRSDVQHTRALPPVGISSYYSRNFNETDRELIEDYLQFKNVQPWNMRFIKREISDDEIVFEIRAASEEKPTVDPNNPTVLNNVTLDTIELFRGYSMKFTTGDFSSFMGAVRENLDKAREFAEANQKQTLKLYSTFLRTGSLKVHKEATRRWIKERNLVDFHLGFHETYGDPSGSRGQFQSYVGIQNPSQAGKFSAFGSNASELVELLPWPREFERDHFDDPTFLAVDIVSMCGNVPLAVNLPNYNDVISENGSKNLILVNMINAQIASSQVRFLDLPDTLLLKKYAQSLYSIHTGIHELLGHGSGKLFMEYPNGTMNFDRNETFNLLDWEQIDKWYKPGENFQTVFGQLGNVLEECRADAAFLALSLEPRLLRIFGFKGKEARDVAYASWVNMMVKSINSLKAYYEGYWHGAHANARYIILRYLYENAHGLLKLEIHNKKKIMVKVDRNEIFRRGKEVIRELLMKLQNFKSTADVTSARDFIGFHSFVHPKDVFDRMRVLLHREPDRSFFMIVQPNIVKRGSLIQLHEIYPNDVEGVLDSWHERFSDADVEFILRTVLKEHRKDVDYFH